MIDWFWLAEVFFGEQARVIKQVLSNSLALQCRH